MQKIDFKDRVIIVTGAGAGLGRTYAMDFARRGANVVVNDLGGGLHGGGNNIAVADQVVSEIKAAGGQAIPDYHSVEQGEMVVTTALEHFGRIDVVINNAGILRDKSFMKMSDKDWDMIYRVHVLGTYKVTKAAWPHMREQGFGRIVNTCSPSGIYGNFGQANYGMAKIGIYGLTRTLALEGANYGICVNAIAPYASSRMSASTNDSAELLEILKPELVTPLVVRLSAAHNTETGSLFEVGGGLISKLRWEQSDGAQFSPHELLTAEDVDEAWQKICDFSEAHHLNSINESFERVLKNAGLS